MDISGSTEMQRQAYERARALLLKGRKPDEPRILGLFAGLMKGADDFDAPLPDEDLFYGSETDACGIYQGPDAESNP